MFLYQAREHLSPTKTRNSVKKQENQCDSKIVSKLFKEIFKATGQNAQHYQIYFMDQVISALRILNLSTPQLVSSVLLTIIFKFLVFR